MDPFLIPQIIDLAGENPVKTYRQPLASGDSGAHTWEVRIVRGGVAVDLTGCTATLNVRRDGDADEATLRKRATIAGNRVSCELPRGVYELGGKLTAVMIVEDSAGRVVTAAVLLLRGKQYITDHIADPDGTLPSVPELLQRVAAMEGTVSQLKDDKANKADALSLEEIQASTDLSGKIASASSVKTIFDIINLSIPVPYNLDGKDNIINNCKYVSSIIEPFQPRMLAIDNSGRGFVIGYTYSQSVNTQYAQYLYYVIGNNILFLVNCYSGRWDVFKFEGVML